MSGDIPYCISGGIGDLFITRVLFDHNGIEEPISISEYELMYFRGNNMFAAKFSYDLACILFKEPHYITGQNYAKIDYQDKYWFNDKPMTVRPYLYLNNEKKDYIIIHTKVRADRDKDKIGQHRKLLLDFCKEKQFKTKVILIGEQEVSDNIETKEHGQYSVYNELMELKNNNEVIDYTHKELYNCPNYLRFRRDVELIGGASHVISLGWGGNYALTWGVADNYTAWVGNEPHRFLDYMEIKSTEHKKNIRNFTQFIDEIKKL